MNSRLQTSSISSQLFTRLTKFLRTASLRVLQGESNYNRFVAELSEIVYRHSLRAFLHSDGKDQLVLYSFTNSNISPRLTRSRALVSSLLYIWPTENRKPLSVITARYFVFHGLTASNGGGWFQVSGGQHVFHFYSSHVFYFICILFLLLTRYERDMATDRSLFFPLTTWIIRVWNDLTK